jgi:hypothetical protein
MRTLALLGCLAVVALLMAAPPGAQTTTALSATFNEGFGRATAHPCPATETFSWCGAGTVVGFGEATSLTEVTGFSNFDPETACADITLRRTLTFTDGSTLVLEETGTVCFPGTSASAPGSMKSFGNPLSSESTFTIISGTGRFAGATGSGTATTKGAGDAAKSTLTGTITLP